MIVILHTTNSKHHVAGRFYKSLREFVRFRIGFCYNGVFSISQDLKHSAHVVLIFHLENLIRANLDAQPIILINVGISAFQLCQFSRKYVEGDDINCKNNVLRVGEEEETT